MLEKQKQKICFWPKLEVFGLRYITFCEFWYPPKLNVLIHTGWHISGNIQGIQLEFWGVCCSAEGSGIPVLGWEEDSGHWEQQKSALQTQMGPCRCVTVSCEQHPVFHLKAKIKLETKDSGFIWTDSAGNNSLQIIMATAVSVSPESGP